MPLAVGQTLTHYKVLGPLGAGAMGEVYRARDTRLEREVALKVLPENLAGDEERLRRFEREAKALASLNHPNVAQVFGIDQVGDTSFMAMELVPGEDLAARLSRGALPIDEAIDICRQIAEGVEAAHEAGVIHRDLKPANVVVTPEGRVKVLDFGLAKPADAGAAGASTTDSVLTTEEGRLLGTPTYMAPEQARGKPIDRRVDVWAFGCVLYECLAGRRAFDGETMGDVLAAVLDREPDWSSLPSVTPSGLRELIERCVRKDARRRLRDVGDARIAIEDLGRVGDNPTPARAASRPRGLGVGLAVGGLVVAGTLGFWLGRGGQSTADPPRYVSVPLTASNGYRMEPSWSPGGEWLALGRMENGSEDLYLRHVATWQETLRRSGPGDESAFTWSPDDQYIAFVASDLPGTPVRIATPPYTEGSERTLVETNARVFDSATYGAVLGDRPWSTDGRFLLVSRAGDEGAMAVWRVGLQDGAEAQLTFPPIGHDDLVASYSFAGDRILFLRRGIRSGRLMLMSAEGGEPEELLADAGLVESAAWLPGDERILYVSTTGSVGNMGNMWEIDLEEPSRTRQLTSFVDEWVSGLAVSSNGRIAYATSRHDTILTTMDLEARQSVPRTNHARTNFGPRFSPDGLSIAYSSDRTGDHEIWVHDLDGLEHRITHSAGNDVYPDWSPDGRRLVFVSDRSGSTEIYIADRESGNINVLESQVGIATGSAGGRDSMSVRWSPASPAGELIGFIVESEQGRDLWGIPPDDSSPARMLLEDVVSFDWYLDSRRVVCTRDRGRAEELVAVDLETGEERRLWKGPHAEIDVAPDGGAVMFCNGLGHLNMGLATLELIPPEGPEGLPAASGEPVEIVRPEGHWHVHHGGWAPDSNSVVYVRDEDRGNIWELVEQR